MKTKDILYIILSLVVIALFGALFNEKEKSKRKDELLKKLRKENFSLKVAYLNLLEKYLKECNRAEPSVIQELQHLKNEIDGLDSATHIELNSVIKRVNDNEGSKTVKDLAKVVENTLKVRVQNDHSFKKKPMLHNLLEYAVKCKWISDRMYTNALLLKEIRNKESHELAVQLPNHEIGMVLFTSIEIIYTLHKRPSLIAS